VKSKRPRSGRAGSSPADASPPRLTEIAIKSWEHYLRLVSEPPLREWAFRGQRDATWQLWPTISRELRNRRVASQYWTDQEHRLIWIFQRKALHFLERVPDVVDTPQWMALMQHHGGPTRLLDFTWSPYVAAFFAVESSVSDAAVWAINAPKLGTYAYGPQFPPGNRPPSPRDVLMEAGFRGRDAVAIGEPYFKNRRVVAQSGTFAWPFDVTRPLDVILSRKEDVIVKLTLKADVRLPALRELYRMNITYATLFPDLDGLARSLAFELEHHWRFDPTKPVGATAEEARPDDTTRRRGK